MQERAIEKNTGHVRWEELSHMRLRSAFMPTAIVLSFAVLMSCSPTRKAAPFNFLDNFGSGSISPPDEVKSTPAGKPVFIEDEFAVGGEKRRAMITLAAAKIVFDVGALGKESQLRFSVGMNSTIGDGAEGIITVEADGQPEVVYRRYIDPIDRSDERRWFEESVDLSKFAGKKVMISFEAGPGPNGNGLADWFAWANIELT
jgi:hypothetical protein